MTLTYRDKAQHALYKKARGIFDDKILAFQLLDMIELMRVNNKFAALGIFITDDNREEQYIKVIESGDDSLIVELENYINLTDKIKELATMRQEFNDVLARLNAIEDPEDEITILQTIEDYLRR